jgi:hypothetical protein
LWLEVPDMLPSKNKEKSTTVILPEGVRQSIRVQQGCSWDGETQDTLSLTKEGSKHTASAAPFLKVNSEPRGTLLGGKRASRKYLAVSTHDAIDIWDNLLLESPMALSSSKHS